MRFSKPQLIFAGIVLLLAVAVAVAIVWLGTGKPRYAAVRLATGELYFGKLSRFPVLALSRVWYIQPREDGSFSLERFQNLLWQPSDVMRLSRDKIVFWAYLQPDSPVIEAIEGRVPLRSVPAGSPLPDGNLDRQLPQLPTPSPRPGR